MTGPDRIPRRPTPAELQRARERTVADVLCPGLDAVFVGINPSLYSAAVGHHFARPGNRFWPALHHGGWTDRLLQPHEDRSLARYGIGITNFVARATAKASELRREELVEGLQLLRSKVESMRPRAVVVLGITAYEQAFGSRHTRVGCQQECFAGAQLWILPNPSGLNAHYQLPEFGMLFAAARRSIRGVSPGSRPITPRGHE